MEQTSTAHAASVGQAATAHTAPLELASTATAYAASVGPAATAHTAPLEPASTATAYTASHSSENYYLHAKARPRS